MSEAIATSAEGESSVSPGVAWTLAPLLVGLGTLAVGVATLAPFRSLSTDEAVALARAREPLRDLLHTIVHDEPAQAGHLLLLEAAALAGTDERTARAASLAALALAAALLVVLGTRLLGRVEGLVAGIALGASAGPLAVAREAAPYALGLLGIVVATLALVLALERDRGWWWVLYGVACVALPLTHPLAASVLLAHVAALATRRGPHRSRVGLATAAAGLALSAAIVAWLALDRSGTAGGSEDLASFGRGLLAAIGWSPVLVAAAVAGLASIAAGRPTRVPLWKTSLVAGMVVSPALVAVVAGAFLAIFPDPALVACAPGLALAAGAACRLLPNRQTLWIGALAFAAVAAVTVGITVAAPAPEDWHRLAAAAHRVRGSDESFVVLPPRSRAAFSYYAPTTRTTLYARGNGAWVAVAADSPAAAIAIGRRAVRTPRYALLRQFRYGSGLRLQHWVRP